MWRARSKNAHFALYFENNEAKRKGYGLFVIYKHILIKGCIYLVACKYTHTYLRLF